MPGGLVNWWLTGTSGVAVTADRLPALLQHRLDRGDYETVLASDAGARLHVVTNGRRALVMLLANVDDAGMHAIDLTGPTGTSGGYRLTNGQIDEYPDADTLPWPAALDLVSGLLDGQPPAVVEWQVD